MPARNRCAITTLLMCFCITSVTSNASVEADLEGYQFWLREFNRAGDYRGVTRAFIESEEYKAQTP